MNTYLIIIKSHCEYPDFESEVEASNRKQAIEMFYGQLQGGYDRKFINENIGRLYRNGKIK